MASRFTPVTLDEMKDHLKASKGWILKESPKSHEYYFAFPIRLNPDIEVHVQSTITRSGVSRGRGKDAIRVYAVDVKNERGYIRTRKVLRVQNWRDNLEDAIMDIFTQAWDRVTREKT